MGAWRDGWVDLALSPCLAHFRVLTRPVYESHSVASEGQPLSTQRAPRPTSPCVRTLTARREWQTRSRGGARVVASWGRRSRRVGREGVREPRPGAGRGELPGAGPLGPDAAPPPPAEPEVDRAAGSCGRRGAGAERAGPTPAAVSARGLPGSERRPLSCAPGRRRPGTGRKWRPLRLRRSSARGFGRRGGAGGASPGRRGGAGAWGEGRGRGPGAGSVRRGPGARGGGGGPAGGGPRPAAGVPGLLGRWRGRVAEGPASGGGAGGALPAAAPPPAPTGASGWGVAIRSVEMRRRAAAAGPEALSSELPLRRACWTLRKGAPGSCCFSSDRQRITGARAPAGGSGWAGVRTRRPVDDSLPPAGAPPGGARARRPAVLCQVNRVARPPGGLHRAAGRGGPPRPCLHSRA